MLDFAGGVKDTGMTAPSFRGLLEGAAISTRNRTYVLSGLQSGTFETQPSKQSFDFRLVVAADAAWPSTFKYVCCVGECPGSPSTVSPVDADGYTRLLYDTVNDPFDMVDLKAKHPDIAEQLRQQLPVANGFDCGSSPSPTPPGPAPPTPAQCPQTCHACFNPIANKCRDKLKADCGDHGGAGIWCGH